METVKIPINKIKFAPYNPRKISKEEYDKLKRSIERFGYVDPIIWNKRTGFVVGGNQRLRVLKDLGFKEVDVIVVDLSLEEEKALNVALNKISGEWDDKILKELLDELVEKGFDLELTGFDFKEYEELIAEVNEEPENIDRIPKIDTPDDNVVGLNKKYIVPPFSILDARQGYWTDRKRRWFEIIKDRGNTREHAQDESFGVSVLDPVLAEVIIKWFTPKKSGNYVFDTFAGDTVFGFVASYYENYFTGIELRQEQVDFNNTHTNKFANYICDDGRNVDKHIKPNTQDLYFSCPPYFDLEVYSDLPNDASNQESFDEFYAILEEAFKKAVKLLKQNRFAVVVVGDVRDKKSGGYYDLVGRVKQTFMNEGLYLYNDIVLVDPVGTARLRANRNMRNRKVVKTHQNVLVFYKGDTSKIKDEFYNLEVLDDEGTDF